MDKDKIFNIMNKLEHHPLGNGPSQSTPSGPANDTFVVEGSQPKSSEKDKLIAENAILKEKLAAANKQIESDQVMFDSRLTAQRMEVYAKLFNALNTFEQGRIAVAILEENIWLGMDEVHEVRRENAELKDRLDKCLTALKSLDVNDSGSERKLSNIINQLELGAQKEGNSSESTIEAIDAFEGDQHPKYGDSDNAGNELQDALNKNLGSGAATAESPKGTEEDKSPNEENASRGEDELLDAPTENLQKVSTNEKPASEGTLLTPEFDKIMLELKKYSTFRGAYNDEEKRTIASHATGVQPRANVGCKFRCKCENADFVPYRDFINCASSKNNLHKCHARDLPDELIRELIKSDTNRYKCPFKLCKDSDEMSNSELRDHLKHKAHPLKGDRNGDEEVAAEYGDLIRKMRAEKIKAQ